MATAELMDGSNSRQQPPTIPSSQRAPNHAWEGREGGRREGSYVWLWQRRRRRRRQRGMNLLHAIRPFVWKRSERASVGRRSKGTTDDEYNQLEVQIGRLRLEVGQEGHLNPENGTNSITERVEMISNDLADIVCGEQPVEFTPVARRGLPR